LNGKRFAVHSEGAVSTAMAKYWVDSTCKGTPNYLIIAGSDNRAAALMNGQIDATNLELSDWINVSLQQPGKFHLVGNLAKDTPDLMVGPVVANTDFAERNRDVLVAYLAELVKTHRIVNASPKIMEDYARKMLPNIDAKAIPEIVKAYQEINAFDANGGLTARKMEGSIKFFTDAQQLEPGMTVQKAANLTYLEDALKLVGGRM
jgi:NitT/TauT family transport system substrate-binding protein